MNPLFYYCVVAAVTSASVVVTAALLHVSIAIVVIVADIAAPAYGIGGVVAVLMMIIYKLHICIHI